MRVKKTRVKNEGEIKTRLNKMTQQKKISSAYWPHPYM